MDNFDLKKYLAEGRILKENIDFPELEYEFEKTMRSIVVKPEVYFQGIIDASAEEIVSDDYYERMNAVEMGTYSAEEAVKLAKAWAKEKLSNLAEGKLNENRPHPTEVFTDEELDYVGDMMVAMYEKLGLADEEDPSSTNVVKALALSDRIEGFFETLN